MMISSHRQLIFLDLAWRGTEGTERPGGVQPRSLKRRRCRDFFFLAISENEFLVFEHRILGNPIVRSRIVDR